ncbi:caspase family protein [Streptomyces sp. NPDC093707]|uniref:caspase family protein n=1 Tax=Streptomyces sp. NPDC093707 TaxID=3154984 RepID=UPI00344CBEBA
MRRYRGLLIGNATFPRDPHALPDLHGPLVDIAQLKQALTDDRVGLFRADDLQEIPDHGIQDIRERVDELFTTAAREDVLLLYYSGHGQLDELGALYLCAKDTSTSRLRASGLSAIEINNMIDGSAATTTVVILDCCYSGAFKGTARSAPTAGKGRYVLTSSRSTQLARAATDHSQPSPFTGQLVRGLHHAEATGHLTIVELYRQVHRWMIEDAIITPQLRIAGEGDVAIAHRPNPPLPTPAATPAPAPVSARNPLSRRTVLAGVLGAAALAGGTTTTVLLSENVTSGTTPPHDSTSRTPAPTPRTHIAVKAV